MEGRKKNKNWREFNLKWVNRRYQQSGTDNETWNE